MRINLVEHSHDCPAKCSPPHTVDTAGNYIHKMILMYSREKQLQIEEGKGKEGVIYDTR